MGLLLWLSRNYPGPTRVRAHFQAFQCYFAVVFSQQMGGTAFDYVTLLLVGVGMQRTHVVHTELML